MVCPYRGGCSQSESDLAAAGPCADGYVVAGLLADDLFDLRLTIVPDPAESRGHCLIPELAYGRHKEKEAKELRAELVFLVRSIWTGDQATGPPAGDEANL